MTKRTPTIRKRPLLPNARTWEILDEMTASSGRAPEELVHLAVTLFAAASRDVRVIAGATRAIHADRSAAPSARRPLGSTVSRILARWRPRP